MTKYNTMYNTLKLQEDQWCFQRYIWNDTLEVNQQPEEKVIKTLIYGIRSRGNYSELGIRQTAKLSKEDYPEVNEIINNDLYVDHCISGKISNEAVMERADQMDLVLSKEDLY